MPDKVDVTVIISSSPVPSNPSTTMIANVIKSLALIDGLEKSDIVIALDGCSEDAADEKTDYLMFQQKLQKLQNKDSRIRLSIRETHGHLAGNIRHCLGDIKTKYIFLIQHDFIHIQPFSMSKVIEDMELNPLLKHVRFNKRQTVQKRIDKDFFGTIVSPKNYEYTQTGGWSDNNHVCLTNYYTNFILPQVPDGTTMEREIYFNIIRSDLEVGKYHHEDYGTYIFGPVNHPTMITHLDGRNEELMNLSFFERCLHRLKTVLKMTG